MKWPCYDKYSIDNWFEILRLESYYISSILQTASCSVNSNNSLHWWCYIWSFVLENVLSFLFERCSYGATSHLWSNCTPATLLCSKILTVVVMATVAIVLTRAAAGAASHVRTTVVSTWWSSCNTHKGTNVCVCNYYLILFTRWAVFLPVAGLLVV